MTKTTDSLECPSSFNEKQCEQFKSLTQIMREAILNAMEGMTKGECYYYAKSSKIGSIDGASVQFTRCLKNDKFKALYESVTTVSYAQIISKRDYLASKLITLIDADKYKVPEDEPEAGSEAIVPIKTSDRTAAMKQYADLFDLTNARFNGGTLDLTGMDTSQQLDTILLALACGTIDTEKGRTIMAVIKLKTDIKDQLEMQEKVENIEKMLMDARSNK